MRGAGYVIGAALGLGIVVAGALTERAPLRAEVPAPAIAAQAPVQAPRATAFAPRRATAPAAQAAHAADAHVGMKASYLSMVAGDAGSGAPAVAAVKDHGRLRLVQAGDTVDGAVVAAIEPQALTLRAPAGVVVRARGR